MNDIELKDGYRLVFQKERAFAVMRKLLHIYNNSNSAINNFLSPQLLVPKHIEIGSKSHANHLLALTICDSRMDSDYLYRGMQRASERRFKDFGDNLFDSETLLSIKGPKELEKELLKENFRLSPQKKLEWILEGARVIKEEIYGEDLRNLAQICSNNIKLTQDFLIRHFQGLGIGTSSLLLRYMSDIGMWKFEESECTPIKVDIHKFRFPFAMNFYKLFNGNEEIKEGYGVNIDENVENLQEMYKSLFQEFLGRSNPKLMSAFDEIIWKIGSNMCRKEELDICETCPLYDNCQGLPHTIYGQRKDIHKKSISLPFEDNMPIVKIDNLGNMYVIPRTAYKVLYINTSNKRDLRRKPKLENNKQLSLF